MISIKFLDENKNNLTVINTFFDIRVKNKLSDTSTSQFTIPYNTETVNKLKSNVRKVWNIVEIRINLEWWWNVFTGIIRKTTITWLYIVFDCIDLVSYYRSFSKQEYNRTWYNQTKQVNDFIIEALGNYSIDKFTIWKNNNTDTININLDKEKTFFDVMDYLKKEHNITRRSNWYNLDVIWVFDEIQKWLWKYDYTDIIWSDIYDFKRIESLDSLLLNDKTDNYPSINIEEPKRYKYKVWQKKAIQINTQLDWGLAWYVWIITEINLKAEATKVVGTIKVDNKPRQKTDEALRGVLENLHNRVIKI